MTRMNRSLALLLVCGGASVCTGQDNPKHDNPKHVEVPVAGAGIETMRVTLNGRQGGYTPRDNCPQVSSHTNSSFAGGTYTAQGGFAEHEVAAASYTLAGSLFPLKITLMEFLVAQLNATETTTTEWSVLIWSGLPSNGLLVAEYSSDGTILPHIIMGPGTRGTNLQVQVDPNDPEQIFILHPNPDPDQNPNTPPPPHTFSIGLRIDHHNAQQGDPCSVAPPSNRNAFPCTDNTTIGCGTGYAALNHPNDNWLFALNCGPNGCPPNGGWTRLGNLQTDFTFFGQCFTGCRPRGDWVMRATWDPVNCPPSTGACCVGTNGCFLLSQSDCVGGGGMWRGGGTVCGDMNGNGQHDACEAPVNNPPIANAGPDQVVPDADGNGSEVISVNGGGSSDPDAGDFIANYLWREGATTLQDGPAFLSVTLPVGTHTLTLTVTDTRGATASDTVVVDITGAPPCDPDLNGDGNVDQDDVACIIDTVAGNPGCSAQDPDFNHDGNVDQDDVAAVINAVAGGGCP